MQVFFFIAYVIVGLLQFFAIIDGLSYAFDINVFFAAVIALFTTYIPLLGSGLGVYGAISVWGWELWQALLLFFWYVPFGILMAFAGAFSRA